MHPYVDTELQFTPSINTCGIFCVSEMIERLLRNRDSQKLYEQRKVFRMIFKGEIKNNQQAYADYYVNGEKEHDFASSWTVIRNHFKIDKAPQ